MAAERHEFEKQQLLYSSTCFAGVQGVLHKLDLYAVLIRKILHPTVSGLDDNNKIAGAQLTLSLLQLGRVVQHFLLPEFSGAGRCWHRCEAG